MVRYLHVKRDGQRFAKKVRGLRDGEETCDSNRFGRSDRLQIIVTDLQVCDIVIYLHVQDMVRDL